MNVIFWSPIDDVVAEYVKVNRSLARLSEAYPFVAVVSGKLAPKLCRKTYRNVIETKNVMRTKMEAIYQHVAELPYDVLVKLDCECLIVDLPWLLRLIDEHVQPMTAAGVLGKVHEQRYLRGGCIAAHRSVIQAIQLADEPKHKEDQLFADACLRAGVRLVAAPLFEQGESWTGHAPLWHPPKCGGGKRSIPARLRIFRKVKQEL